MVRKAERIVLPGVGAFKDCYEGLTAVPGMRDTLQEQVVARGKPFLGICVGMQMLASRGHEYRLTEGFGWIPGDVVRIEPEDRTLKVPHMGWNRLQQKPHALWAGIADGARFYFVHSYCVQPADSSVVTGTAEYGVPFTCAVGRDNIFAVQFHPEKSAQDGLQLLKNFVAWQP